MTSNRELLEAAAQAAGIVTLPTLQPLPALRVFGGYWNPLTDDGDALRLAVKLRMEVWHVRDTAVVTRKDLGARIKEPHGTDPLAATRRAIVRAAAAMEKKT